MHPSAEPLNLKRKTTMLLSLAFGDILYRISCMVYRVTSDSRYATYDKRYTSAGLLFKMRPKHPGYLFMFFHKAGYKIAGSGIFMRFIKFFYI